MVSGDSTATTNSIAKLYAAIVANQRRKPNRLLDYNNTQKA